MELSYLMHKELLIIRRDDGMVYDFYDHDWELHISDCIAPYTTATYLLETNPAKFHDAHYEIITILKGQDI